MSNLMEKKPILHAVLWIAIYIAAVNAGDAWSEATGMPYITGILLILLSAVLFAYLRKNQRLTYYGLRKVSAQDARRALFYIPLIVLAFIQLFVGVSRTAVANVTVTCLLMAGTGFIEEMLFRGFLYQGIRRRRGVVPAILISGITFGLGHVVNLLRGYTLAEQAEQIATAVVIGIVLAMLVAISRSIVPGILFHIIFNITGTIAAPDNVFGHFQTLYLLLAILVISALYAVSLIRFVPKQKDENQTA